MAKSLKVDVSALPSHEERIKIMELFETSFDVTPCWTVLDLLHKTVYEFDAFWAYESKPPIPKVPDCVKITVR